MYKQVVTAFMVIGLGASLYDALGQTRLDILSQIRTAAPVTAPSFFVVMPDQTVRMVHFDGTSIVFDSTNNSISAKNALLTPKFMVYTLTNSTTSTFQILNPVGGVDGVEVYRNGLLQANGVDYDASIAPNTQVSIIFRPQSNPVTGDTIILRYYQ